MKNFLFITMTFICVYSLSATTFRITGYLPSYRLESSQRAVGGDVLDISAFTPTYDAVRYISQLNLENSHNTLPPAYDYSSIENWYGQNVSDIIYFSIKPAANGSLDLSGIKDRDLSRLNNISHSYGTNLIIAVSGSSELFNPVAESDELRQTFISNLLTFCKDHNFSGVDFDWEFPRTEDEIENFSLLIKESVALFSANKRTVSAAINRFIPLKQEIYDNLDYINLMAYDLPGRHSTYESAVEAAEYLQKKYTISPEKINLGIPFYGRIYSNLHPQYWRKTMIYKEIHNTFAINTNQDEAGGYYYNSIDTVKRKTNYARENKLGGIMIWELGQDTLDEFSLLKAIKEEIR